MNFFFDEQDKSSDLEQQATLRQPQISQYTASKEGGYKTNANIT